MMEYSEIIFVILLFAVAALYASVGHGGASGYLALMGLFHFTPEMMRPSALMLNIFVSIIAFWQFSRTETLNRKLFLWLIAGSIPAAFLGAYITIDANLYRKILGVLLLFQSLRLIGVIKDKQNVVKEPKFTRAFITGTGIGFVSGLIGIGGGIILSPILLILGWVSMKQTALVSALFIFLNSTSGLTGLLFKGAEFDPVLYLWIAVALTGGLLGSWMGSRKLSPNVLKQILGAVLLIAGIKLILS